MGFISADEMMRELEGFTQTIVAEYNYMSDGRVLTYTHKTDGFDDLQAGRIGEWLHTSTGGRFYPLDPRPEEIHVSDIANGLSLDCRYGGQGRTDRYYSVAEHSYHMAWYAWKKRGWLPLECLAVLFHDAAEAYINDLPRAVKHGAGPGYAAMEEAVQSCILRKYGLDGVSWRLKKQIKDLDRSIVPLEKAAIMRVPQPWAYDQFKPLEGINIACWEPKYAKRRFLNMYVILWGSAGLTPEEVDYE